MTGVRREQHSAQWRELLELSQRFLDDLPLSTQHDLIVNTFGEIFHARVEMCLSETIFHILSTDVNSCLSAEGNQGLLREAYDTCSFRNKANPGNSATPETERVEQMAGPLVAGQDKLGAIQVERAFTQPFTKDEKQFFQEATSYIAMAIKSLRLYNDLRKRAEQISVVAEVSRAIISILDVDEILKELVTLLHERFGYPYVHAFTVHPGRKKIFYIAGSGPRSTAFAEKGLAYDLDSPTGIIPWVAREGKTVVANDVSKEPRYRPNELPPLDTRAELAVPFIYNGDVLGLLDVQSDQVGVFDEKDWELFETLAANAAVAMRNAGLYRSEKWRRQVAESLRDVAGLLSTNPDLDEVLHAILVELQRNLPCEVTAIWLIGEDLPNLQPEVQQRLHLAALQGVDGKILDRMRSIRADDDYWLNKTLNSDIAVIRQPNDPIGPLGSALQYNDDYSSLGVPLRAGEQALGVLAMAHPSPGRYGGEAQNMAGAFASYAAVAIENTRLYASAQEQAWVSTVLLQVAEATQSLTSQEELLETVTRLTPMLVGVRGCAVFLWNPTANIYRMAATYGLSSDQEADFKLREIIPGSAPAFDKLKETHAPVFISDCRKELGLLATTECEPDQYGFILVPLETRGELSGVFLIEQIGLQDKDEEETPISRERLSILQGLANQTAIAIENIRLIEGKQEEAYVSAVLLQVAQAVVGSNNLDDVLSSIVHLMPILVGIDCSLIYLWEKSSNHFHLAQAYLGSWKVDDRFSQKEFTLGEYPILDAVMAKDGMVICPLADNSLGPEWWSTLIPPQTDEEAAQSLEKDQDILIGTPLSVKGEIYGVLVAQESGVDPSFRARRLEIINGIAQQTALAIQNDHLNEERVERERLEREFQLARDIQRTFLPSSLPEPKGWDLAVRWQPARLVGGDFYDAFTLPQKRLGIVIADVSDKGMPAALYMTVARTLIRAAAQEETSPAKVLARVNNLLMMDSQYGMFVTCVYGVVDLKSGIVAYANSGHNIPLVIRQHGESVQRLEKGGMAMAVLENEHTEDHQIALEEGDMLILYTDGVTEAFSLDDELFGEDCLIQTVKENSTASAEEMIYAITQDLAIFTQGAQPSDDITLLALKRIKSE